MKNNCQPLRELSLFTGAGGGLLGSVLLGHRIVGAVEFDEYCCRVLHQRQQDGILDPFPIFNTDIRDFIRHGYASLYKGRCDLISAGFPCQPFSIAGKRAGADDPRNMWPATIATIREVRPRYCFLENVPGLLASGYFGTILGDLAESGYDARWRILSAAEVGAPHKRDRLWIVAHTRSSEWGTPTQPGQYHPRGQHPVPAGRQQSTDGLGDLCADVGNTTGARLADGREAQVGESRQEPQSQRPGWWEAEPAFCRVVDGYAGKVAELKAAGNAQVASVAAAAWQLLTAGGSDRDSEGLQL